MPRRRQKSRDLGKPALVRSRLGAQQRRGERLSPAAGGPGRPSCFSSLAVARVYALGSQPAEALAMPASVNRGVEIGREGEAECR